MVENREVTTITPRRDNSALNPCEFAGRGAVKNGLLNSNFFDFPALANRRAAVNGRDAGAPALPPGGARAGAGRTASKSGDVHDLPVQLGEGAKAPSTARGPGSGTAALTGETAVRSGEDLKILCPNGAGDESPASGLPRPGQRTSSVHPALGSRGQASFIVPPGTRGLSMGQKFSKHNIRASHTAEAVLDDVRVPGRCLVGSKEKLDRRLARDRRDGRRRRPAADLDGAPGAVAHPCRGIDGQAGVGGETAVKVTEQASATSLLVMECLRRSVNLHACSDEYAPERPVPRLSRRTPPHTEYRAERRFAIAVQPSRVPRPA